MSLQLDAFSGSLIERIAAAVQDAVHRRQWRAGEQVPSIRQFAASHGVSTFTVVEAYDRLVADGVLIARRGDGFYVRPRAGSGQVAAPRQPQKTADAYWLIDNHFNPADSDRQPGSGWLPADWYDQNGLARSLRALGRDPQPPAHYGDPMGLLRLRQTLAANLGAQGLPATPDNILLTQGASQALQLVIKMLVNSGDVVLVDDPGYCNLITLLKMAGARVIGVPWTAHGPDSAQLAQLMQAHQPRAFFTNPRLHNPTGASYDHATAHRVLQLAEQHACWVVEDDVSAALAEPGSTPLQALAGTQRVIHIGSVSKTLAPSLRVGYVVANDEVIDALVNHKMLTGLTSSLINEQLAQSMLTDGSCRRRLQKLRDRLLAANLAARSGFEALGWPVFAEPAPSLFAWVQLPPALDAVRCTEAALQQDILLAPGVLFRVQPEATPWLRCNVAHLVPEVFAFFASCDGTQ
ncbi:aminotransferase-like domain-containing protein [Vogesella indigofera]|uniref:aminotransferase-like domain-containing protein n=1 Tax=Vogesella indigofera TaxID=45465 RepID=UPI00234F31AC|nr:PLP-dependent aminotransferase family protein [Vogesella indigofera]MDC7699871.1 PLP-dependent aminotransferase family protein [Vogesella indigofera]